MSLTDPYGLPLLSDYRDDFPDSGLDAAEKLLADLDLDEARDMIRVLVGVHVLRDLPRRLRELTDQRPVSEREQAEMVDDARDAWLATGRDRGDRIAAARGRKAWGGDVA